MFKKRYRVIELSKSQLLKPYIELKTQERTEAEKQ